ncbi:MAG: calcium-binding protein [Myxococcota bacterium]
MTLIWLSAVAFAQDPCPAGDVCFPANYWGASCDGVCGFVNGTIACDLDLGSASYDYMVAISDFDGHGSPSYSIFGGTEPGGSTGSNFACYFDNSPAVSTMELGGSGADDLIQLDYVNGFWQLDDLLWVYVWGEAGQDTIRGTNTAVIDFLYDGHNNDTLSDGRWMFGEDSLDTITCSDDYPCSCEGGDHDDTIDCGNNQNCQAWGNHGNDVITGSDYADFLYGGVGDDEVDGGKGADTIYGGPNHDVLNGGEGEDTIYGDGGPDIIDGGPHDDTLYGGDGKDKIFGSGSDDVIYGQIGDDELRGGPGDDVIEGGPGHDQVNSGTGNDEMFGGSGDDTLCDGFDLYQPDTIVTGGGGQDRGWVYYVAGATVTFTSVESCGHANYDLTCTLLFPPTCISEAP